MDQQKPLLWDAYCLLNELDLKEEQRRTLDVCARGYGMDSAEFVLEALRRFPDDPPRPVGRFFYLLARLDAVLMAERRTLEARCRRLQKQHRRTPEQEYELGDLLIALRPS